MTYPMNVFDQEARLSDQAICERCFTLAQAGLTLEEVRAWEGLKGKLAS